MSAVEQAVFGEGTRRGGPRTVRLGSASGTRVSSEAAAVSRYSKLREDARPRPAHPPRACDHIAQMQLWRNITARVRRPTSNEFVFRHLHVRYLSD